MSGGGFGLCRVTTSCQVSSRCLLAETLQKLFYFIYPTLFLEQDENYLVSHILGLVALSLLKVSNTIGNDNIVKVYTNSVALIISPSTFFPGLRGGRGDAYTVLESSWELRQEAGGPGGDGAHRGIGPSSPGPILST